MKKLIDILLFNTLLFITFNANASYIFYGHKYSLSPNKKYCNSVKTQEENNDINYKKDQYLNGVYLGIGYEYNENLKIETEFFHTSSSKKKVNENYYVENNTVDIYSKLKYNSDAIFFNINYDLYKKNNFNLFAIGGAGVNLIKYTTTENVKGTEEQTGVEVVSNESKNKKNLSVAYKLGLGFGYDINEKITTEFRIDYTNLGKAEVKNTKIKIDNYGISIGVKYNL